MAELNSARQKMPGAFTGSTPYEDEAIIDLEELFYRLIEKWKLIVCSALLLSIIFGVITVFFITPKYEASSSIYVVSRSDSVINMSDLNIGSALTQDYIQAFEMWEVHEEVIDNLDLPYNDVEISDMLNVTNRSGTRILTITITSEDPEEAAAVANEYAKVFSKFISNIMSIDEPNVMSTARVPLLPASPNKALNIVLGFVLGAFAAMAYVLIAMLLDDKIKTPEDIRRFCGVVTLASVPLAKNQTANKKAVSKR